MPRINERSSWKKLGIQRGMSVDRVPVSYPTARRMRCVHVDTLLPCLTVGCRLERIAHGKRSYRNHHSIFHYEIQGGF
jgi:hypothetical protein